jgi:alanyl-tRNA synthetase
LSLRVDAERRHALSAAHTSCHLAALAMNRATAGLWRKEARLDSLGSPDLDQLAMVSSVMDEQGSTDVYRFGKSLRRRGFDAVGFGERLPSIVDEVHAQLGLWLASAAPVRVADGGDTRITAVRRWTCTLPDGLADIPCGGTHVTSLAALAEVHVDYQVAPDGTELTVRTTPRLAA